jgi:hypothetical protein
MIYLLLVLYQIKHFACDYPLQGRYMLGKFKPGYEWILPLLAHSSVHGVATFLIALFVKPKSAFWLALLDLTIHFAMDRIKASPNLLGRYKALDANCYPGVAAFASGDFKSLGVQLSKEDRVVKQQWGIQRLKENTHFWWALGLDQGVHHLTHYIIIWRLLT